MNEDFEFDITASSVTHTVELLEKALSDYGSVPREYVERAQAMMSYADANAGDVLIGTSEVQAALARLRLTLERCDQSDKNNFGKIRG